MDHSTSVCSSQSMMSSILVIEPLKRCNERETTANHRAASQLATSGCRLRGAASEDSTSAPVPVPYELWCAGALGPVHSSSAHQFAALFSLCFLSWCASSSASHRGEQLGEAGSFTASAPLHSITKNVSYHMLRPEQRNNKLFT